MSTTSSSSKPSSGWQPPSLEEMQAMLPQYRFEKLLGRGGMGAVYKAVQASLERPVAIKVLPGDLVDDEDANFTERFKNEARTMAKLSHPSIVDVYNFGETQTGLLYIVMEFIEGTDIAQMIQSQGKLPEDYALSITAHVCDALAYAHQNGIIHRDVKPANILINIDGAVKVADFGLAKANDPGQSGITKTNMAMGTPDFVAPEAFIPGVPLDGRADLYAVGVMLYQMLTGEIPRGIWTMPGMKIGTDPRFDAIIGKAMQTDREVRYQTATDIRRDLDTILALPRSALIAQQQAAAEATAQATRAQRQASSNPPKPMASGPQRRAPEQPARSPGKAPKKSSVGMICGITAAVAGIAVAAFMFSGGGKHPTTTSAVAESSSKPRSISSVPKAEPAQSTPSPAPSGGTSDRSAPKSAAAAPAEPSALLVVKAAPVPARQMPAAPAPLGTVDLLALVDVKRDALSGKWEMTSDGLVLARERGVKMLEFNQSAPEEYDFEIEFTITDGTSDVSQVLSVAGRSLRWKMAEGFRPFWSFGPLLDGKKSEDPERTEAVLQRAHLKVGQRYRSTVEVRKDSLRALIDGEEVLKWSGDLKRLGDEAASTLKNGTHLGLACYATGVTFHKAELRPLFLQSNPRLAQLEAGYQARYDSDAQKPFLAAVAALNQSYVANGIGKMRSTARSKGALAEITALDAEKTAIESGNAVPAEDAAGTPDSLKALRSTYRTAYARLVAERDAKAAPLRDIYVKALDAHVTELTKAGKLDEAKQVQALRDTKATQNPGGGVKEAPQQPIIAAVPPAPKAEEFSWRKAAEYLVSAGGRCIVSKDGQQLNVKAAQEIPTGNFDILEIHLDRYGSNLPQPRDDDFQVFNGLKTLRVVQMRQLQLLTDAAFDFLEGNSALTLVSIQGSPTVSDKVLASISKAQKLENLTITGTQGFTGKGLEKAGFLPSLSSVFLYNTALDDAGIQALSSCPNLNVIHIERTQVTDKGLQYLQNTKSLKKLIIKGSRFSRNAIDAFKAAQPQCAIE